MLYQILNKSLRIRFRAYLFLLYFPGVLSGKAYPWSSVKEQRKRVCTTKKCDKLGQMYSAHLNPNVHPCQDFYEHVCGNWGASHPFPPYAVDWTASAIVDEKVLKDQRSLLESDLKSSIMGHAYQACIRRPFLAYTSVDELMKYVERIDHWPVLQGMPKQHRKPWWTIEEYYIKKTGVSAFFDISVSADPNRKIVPLFELEPLTTPYGRILRFYDWKPWDTRAYLTFLEDLIMACYGSAKMKKNEKVIHKDARAVFKFRHELEMIAMETVFTNTEYNLKTVHQLQSITFTETRIKSKQDSINWLQIIQSIYENNVPERVSTETVVNVRNIDYITHLMKLLDKTPEQVIVDHIHLYFLEQHMQLNGPWYRKLIDVTFDKATKIQASRIRSNWERWKKCVTDERSLLNFGEVYAKKFLTPSTKKAAEKIFAGIKTVLEIDVSNSKWLDAETKAKAMSKVREMKTMIGSAVMRKRSRLKVEKRKLPLVNSADVNAYSILNRNTVFVPAAVFYPPLTFTDDSYVVNCATTGTILSHEVYHGFDEFGITFNEKGEVEYWLKNLTHEYEKRKNCFMDQFCSFSLKKDIPENPPTCNGPRIYSEYMADVMGLKLAYQLYKKELFEKGGTCDILPQFNHLTCDQMFFIAYANTHCGKILPDTIRRYVEISTHALPRYRVNGPLSNMEEFGKAFRCKQNDPMKQLVKSTCDLWT